MPFVLAVDAGTTSVRTVAVDDRGAIVRTSARELTQHFPRPGWVEHDAVEIWQATIATMADVCARMQGPPVAIGVTNQRETVVAWSRRTSAPLHRAIVWQDRRTADRCDALVADGLLPLIRDRTGLVADPYFSATKLEWLLGPGGVEPGPDVAVGTIDSWLIWNLTGGEIHATDATNASRTMLFDITTMGWDRGLCDEFGIAASLLPDVRPSNATFGTTAGSAPCGPGVPIAGVAGDQQAALFGQAAFETGDAKNTYGTGSFVLMNVGDRCPPPVEGLVTTVAWWLDGARPTYALEGSIFATGAAVQWLRDGLGIIDTAADLEPLARRCDDTGDVYLVPAFSGLGSPWWDPDARGTIVGLSLGTGRPELARAVIEAMAHQTRDVVDAMRVVADRPLRGLRVDGGASAMDLLLTLQADQLGVPVLRAVHTETTALGAAFLAGLGCGMWSSLDQIASMWRHDGEFVPPSDRTAADRAHRRWLAAVERSRSWARRS